MLPKSSSSPLKLCLALLASIWQNGCFTPQWVCVCSWEHVLPGRRCWAGNLSDQGCLLVCQAWIPARCSPSDHYRKDLMVTRARLLRGGCGKHSHPESSVLTLMFWGYKQHFTGWSLSPSSIWKSPPAWGESNWVHLLSNLQGQTWI